MGWGLPFVGVQKLRLKLGHGRVNIKFELRRIEKVALNKVRSLVGVFIGFSIILGLLRLLLARRFGCSVAPGDFA